MTREDFIAQAEARRKRRERELLLLLLLIVGKAIDEAILAYKHALDHRVVLSNRIVGNPNAGMKGAIQGIVNYLASTHRAGFKLAAKRTNTQMTSALDTLALYLSRAVEFAEAMLAAIDQAFLDGIAIGVDLRNTIKRIRAEIELKGYSKQNPFAIESGVERQVVSAFNNGIGEATITGGYGGFIHESTIDDLTSKYCRPRHLIRLPIEDGYWRTSWPSLHFGCRSLVLPYNGSDWTYAIDVPPAMEGFGRMPDEIAAMIAQRMMTA